MNESISSFSSDSKAFLAIDIGKYHLKKNHEQKNSLKFIFWILDFLLNCVKIHVIYVKKFLTKMDRYLLNIRPFYNCISIL